MTTASPVPSDEISTGAFELASRLLPPPILYHSIRVYLYAQTLAEHRQDSWGKPDKQQLLFVACVLHDIGCAPEYDGPQRFEVEGADAAAALLRQFGPQVDESDIHQVWTAIALHTSPGIAERISDLARLVREGVLIDFGKDMALRSVFGDDDSRALVANFEKLYPRLDVEKELGDCVVNQCKRRPEKAPAPSWPGILYRAAIENPSWEGVNKAF